MSLKEEREGLQTGLDKLLQSYLHLLHEYTTTREQLNSRLSEAYLSLAKANFSNPNRVHYGQDFYDQRMKATIQTVIKYDPLEFELSVPSDGQDSGGHEDGESSLERVDPLKWFGVLVPPTLRSSQGGFREAVSLIARVASLSAQMKELEIDVRRRRKRLSKLPLGSDAQVIVSAPVR